jgi:hypothetical protein
MARITNDRIDKSKIEDMYQQHLSGVSVAKIASYHNVSKQALHYHFKLRNYKINRTRRVKSNIPELNFNPYSLNSFLSHYKITQGEFKSA